MTDLSSDWKKQLRKEKIAQRRSIGAEERFSADQKICETILAMPGIANFDTLAAFVTDGSEPDLRPVMTWALEQGKTLCLPRFLDHDHYEIVKVENLCFSAEKWGIPEPGPEAEIVPAEQLRNALWLVPGVAFDKHGGRLGRGKGIYDRILSLGTGLTIGVFYECQKTDRLPVEAHDQFMDLIVTEAGIYDDFSANNPIGSF